MLIQPALDYLGRLPAGQPLWPEKYNRALLLHSPPREPPVVLGTCRVCLSCGDIGKPGCRRTEEDLCVLLPGALHLLPGTEAVLILDQMCPTAIIDVG